MFVTNAVVEKSIELENKIYLLKLNCPQIASVIKPGQFLNIKAIESLHPLLRRPFSVCDVEGDCIYLMFNVYGEGTRLLSLKLKGETVDVLGPLGNGFNVEGDYETAIFVAGGLGAAPFPFFTKRMAQNKNLLCFIGGRTYKDVIKYRMKNILVATDDGSEGFKGTVIDLLGKHIDLLTSGKTKLFGCGPNAMLHALKEFAIKNNLDCEVSLECAMACGFGICQGCPVESTEQSEKYLLVCKDGPVFNIKDIVI